MKEAIGAGQVDEGLVVKLLEDTEQNLCRESLKEGGHDGSGKKWRGCLAPLHPHRGPLRNLNSEWQYQPGNATKVGQRGSKSSDLSWRVWEIWAFSSRPREWMIGQTASIFV